MATYPFLSDDWFDAVQRIVAERNVELPADADVLMNLIVTETPFGADRLLHVGAKDGNPAWGLGHAEGAHLVLTTDYTTARDIFVSGNPAAGMQAFMEGRVKVQGDLTRLMAAQASGAGPGAPGLAAALSAITE